MQRYSKNRQAILQCLAGTKSHPTAEWIYDRLKTDFPSLSLGTVYRNLSQLKENGIIRSVGIIDGAEHFDYTVAAHPHAICSACGRILDVKEDPSLKTLIETIENRTEFVISELQLTGICPKCRRKDREGNE